MSKNLMAHLVYGFPDVKTSHDLLEGLCALKVEYIELQIPFSDPIADGPILAEANSEAAMHTSTIDVLAYLQDHSTANPKTKVLLMCYFQSIFSFGVQRFCAEAAKANVYGLIVPDVPFDQSEYPQLVSECAKNHLRLVPVLSPNMTLERLRHYINPNTQLVYLTARIGITGMHTSKQHLKNIEAFVNTIKLHAPQTEVALGFGIQTPTDIKNIPSGIDTAVVGSAITTKLLQSGTTGTIMFVKELLMSCLNHPNHASSGTITSKDRE